MMETKKLKNGLEIIIRNPQKSDAKDMLAYLKQVCSETDYLANGIEGVGVDVKGEEELITRVNVAPTSVMYLATIDEKIVGIGSISAHPKSRFSHNAEIGISVLKEFWGLGIGTIIMTELLEFSRNTKHLKTITLDVISENTRAIDLYKKFGFVEIGTHKNYSRVGNKYYDMTIMDLEI